MDDVAFELPDDHPGVTDPAYRARRAAIAAVGEAYRPGRPDPRRRVHGRGGRGLAHGVDGAGGQAPSLRLRRVPRRGRAALAAPGRPCAPAARGRRAGGGADRLAHRARARPRADATVLRRRSPTGGSSRRSTSATTRCRTTHRSRTSSTRSSGTPTCSPRPVLADLYQRAGRASQRARSDAALECFCRVFWFTLEFGVAWEDGELRAYGAGLLSCYGEIETFRDAERAAVGPRGDGDHGATTSPSTSRCCSSPRPSSGWWTSSARSSTATTTRPTCA